jgi:hypothetical protein
VEKNSIELSSLAKHFELYNRTKGKSAKTIRWYNLSLKQFNRFLLKSQNYQAHTDHKQYDCQVGLLSVTASQFR